MATSLVRKVLLLAFGIACWIFSQQADAEPLTPALLVKQSGCLECHRRETGLIGPAFNDIASRYINKRDIHAKLIQTVKEGGKGGWSERARGRAMPPFSGRLSNSEIARIVDWVLGQHELRVMRTGLGAGTVRSVPAGIDCRDTCRKSFESGVGVTLTATPASGSTFSHWEGDASGSIATASVTMDQARTVRAVFNLSDPVQPLSDFTPEGIRSYLAANPSVNSMDRFVSALPNEYKENWVLMSRSESLQTGTAELPRILLPSADAQFVFSFGLAQHGSYPGSHPNAIEYMQWDAGQKNFRFHEIVLDAIPAMSAFPARSRGIAIDDIKCSKCHSTRNVLNQSSYPGTTGSTPGTVQFKSKPNWDTYDSWGGMMPLNRDRIYKGSVEAAAFRRILNPWTWSSNPTARQLVEQLILQPSGVPTEHEITRISGGPYDGHVEFKFDGSSPVLVEPSPTGSDPSVDTNYAFNGQSGTGATSPIVRGGDFVTLHHSRIPTSDEGRGVRLFDALGGLAGTLNQQRVADEVANHRMATGNIPIDVRPVALAIARGLMTIDQTSNTVVSTPSHSVNLSFFDSRNGTKINDLLSDTRSRAESIPRRKADIQKINLDRTSDVYLANGSPANGLFAQYGAATSGGNVPNLPLLRQEVFRRPIDAGSPDRTVMGGIYVDREFYSENTEEMTLFRYFLEPLGVSVDKWSMGVRGRSRNYAFADVFGSYLNQLRGTLRASLLTEPVPGLTDPDDDAQLIAAVNSTLASLPAPDAAPTYTDVQRIFNKACIECHGGLNYPPYSNYSIYPQYHLDLSENENPIGTPPPLVSPRLARSYSQAMANSTADPNTSSLYRRLIMSSESCPSGMMPCGGPSLSKADIETVRRWILGGRSSSNGSFHITTVNGVRYDFQGAGEFVMLRAPNLELQARLTPVATESRIHDAYTGLSSRVSVNTAVALQLGSQRITYQAGLDGTSDSSGMQLRVDGELVKLSAEGYPLMEGSRIIQTDVPGGFQIEVAGGSVITVTPGWWDYYQLWYLHLSTRHIRATDGIMGAVPSQNWLPALPDGTFLGRRPINEDERYQLLYERFANAWRVADDSSLFDYSNGVSTKDFTMREWPKEGVAKSTKVPIRALASSVAHEYVRGIDDAELRANAVQDAIVTGGASFVRTYLMAQRIAANKTPSTPQLVSPDDFQVGLDNSITFVWRKSIDADGDPVTYRHYVWPVGEMPDNNKGTPVTASNATWTSETVSRTITVPFGKAFFWKVIADDGRGGSTDSETRRFETGN